MSNSRLQKTTRLFLFILAFGCHPLLAADDFKVVVSIKPIHSIVAGLMKDIGEPVLLIDGKQTPYTFKPNERHQKLLSDASVVFWVGNELEKSLQASISALSPETRVIELLASPDLKILPSRRNIDLRDPFFWLDDRNVIIMLDEITETLVQQDPLRSHIYQRNRREVLKPLRQIDREYEYGYRGMKAGLGIQYFDVLQYFEQAYALTTLGYVSATPYGKEDAQGLLNIRRMINEGKADCLFVDKSMPTGNLDLLTLGQKVNIGELDALGMEFDAGPELYLKLMQYNTDTIKKCLNADMDEAALARLSAEKSNQAPVSDGIGGRFILTDHMGRTVTEQDMKGRYSLIFFGYSFCPDICPTSLMVLTQAFKQMGEFKEQLQPYFISVDPERDTVEVLRNYVGYFDPRLIGLTGNKQMIRRVAEQFKVKFEKGDIDPDRPDAYTVDHTSSLFLMGPDGRFVTKFAHGITPSELVRQLKTIIGE